MRGTPRIALFADTFHEVNGAARTCREWDAWARRRAVPFLCVRWGGQNAFRTEGPAASLELQRSRLSFALDTDLYFDVRVLRYLDTVEEHVRRFRPDFIHLTSPGDLGVLGALIAHRLGVPLAASWHTNVHEFASRRVARCARWLPGGLRGAAARFVERFVMDRVSWFFGRAQVIFAPNPELADILHRRTGRPVVQMGRGIDSALFQPSRRRRADDEIVLGFVGRLTPEKGLDVLPGVAAALRKHGIARFRFQLAGAGSERRWLERNLPAAVFTGVLTGEALAEAYANADIFLFPSRTDTFGNVVQEALACGVPAVVMNQGGPRFIVRHGSSGIVAANDEEFCRGAVLLAANQRLREEMGRAGRLQVEGQSWNRVFEEVYDGYAACVAVS